jgi:class 3 adenylate cyclase
MRYTEPPKVVERAGPDPRRLRIIATGISPAPLARLSVILAADVVGYTRHMAEDEAGTHARFTEIFRDVIAPRMAREGGRMVKSTGDGFLAEFWSATRAAWFALGVQCATRTRNARRREGRRIEFRIGINLGDVIVEAHDIFGHAVNVAARLEALAEPGGVLVSQAVSAAIRDPGLAFEDAGELPLRNMDQTVRGFRLRGSGRLRI